MAVNDTGRILEKQSFFADRPLFVFVSGQIHARPSGLKHLDRPLSIPDYRTPPKT